LIEQDVKKLKATVDKIFDSEEYKKRRERMDRYYKYYCGYFWPEGELQDPDEAKESKVFINLFFSTIATIAPMLTDNKPIWSVRSEYLFLQPIANLYKAAGDSIWEMEDLEAKIYKIVLDALITGFGVAQVSFDPERTVRGEVAVDVIDPRTYFQAPGFDDNWDAPLCGTVTDRSIWWIKKNYPDKMDEIKPGPSGVVGKAFEKVKETFTGKPMDHEYLGETVKVYTIWMQDETMDEIKNEEGVKEKDENGKTKKKKKYPNGRFRIFTDHVELEDKPYAYNHGKPPWVLCYDYVIPHSYAGMGESQQIEGIVLDYNLSYRKLSKHIRLYADRPWIKDSGDNIPEETFKEDLLSKGPRVWTKAMGSEDPHQLRIDPIDQAIFAHINGSPVIIQDISGLTDLSKGVAGKKQRQSAHEISALLETSYTRTRQRVRNLEHFIKRVFTLIVEIMQQFYTEDRPFSLKNNDGNNEWYNISNKADSVKKLMAPKGMAEGQPEFIEKPNSENDEEYQMEKQQWEDYAELIGHIGEEKSVFFKFRIDIETNSMLPMDKQAMANLSLQLGQQGRLDTLSLLEALHWPNAKRVVERLKAEAQEKAQMAAGPPQGMPAMPQGGMNG